MANKKLIDHVEWLQRIVWVVDERLLYHSREGKGRLLENLHYDRTWEMRRESREDLPFVQLVGFTTEEEMFEGGQKEATVQKGELAIQVAAPREFGMTRRNPVPPFDEDDGDGVVTWVERVKQAITTKAATGSMEDVTLEGMTHKPVRFRTGDLTISDLTAALIVEMMFVTRPFCPADRTARTL